MIKPYMRHIVIDQKSNDTPQPAVAIVHTNKPTPISLKGLYLQKKGEITGHKRSKRFGRVYETWIAAFASIAKHTCYYFTICPKGLRRCMKRGLQHLPPLQNILVTVLLFVNLYSLPAKM